MERGLIAEADQDEQTFEALGKRAQDVLQDAAVAIVVALGWGIDTNQSLEINGRTVFLSSVGRNNGRLRQTLRKIDRFNGNEFSSIQAKQGCVLAFHELQMQDAHANEV